jgi:hypothetical protein
MIFLVEATGLPGVDRKPRRDDPDALQEFMSPRATVARPGPSESTSFRIIATRAGRAGVTRRKTGCGAAGPLARCPP